MKGVVVTADEKMYIKDFADPLCESLANAVDGWIELVHPIRLSDPLCMIVDEEGLLKYKFPNSFGSYLYGSDLHYNPIVGDIVVMATGFRNGELDIVGLTDNQVAYIKSLVHSFSGGRIKEVSDNERS